MARDNKFDRRLCRQNALITGFTLMEMLTVIGILGLLAALIIPAAIHAKKRAQQTKCIANLKQFGIALNIYVSDNEAFPLYVSNSKSDRAVNWREKLTSIKPPEEGFEDEDFSNDMVVCPAKGNPTAFEGSTSVYRSYGYNAYGLGGDKHTKLLGLGGTGSEGDVWWERLGSPVNSGSVVSPSAMLAVGDGVRGCGQVVKDGTTILGREKVDPVPARIYKDAWRRINSRHKGKIMATFVDGHVAGISLTSAMVSESDKALSMWNRDGKPHRERVCK